MALCMLQQRQCPIDTHSAGRCMDHVPGACRTPHLLRAGLVYAVELLQPIKDQVPNVSWADLMQMASALAVEDAGGPKIDMRYGREDCPTEDLKAADGVLPGKRVDV
jgi:Peroxidase